MSKQERIIWGMLWFSVVLIILAGVLDVLS